jgi:hypothetical protein
MPKKTTKRFAIDGTVAVQVCRREALTAPCAAVGAPLHLTPGATGLFAEQLPESLTSGSPRVLYYSVRLLDPNGGSTGLANDVATLAGAPLPAVAGFTAELTPTGVVLRWTPSPAANEPSGTLLQLRRIRGILKPPSPDSALAMPQERLIEVGPQSGHALDTEVRPGDAYLYAAQRLVRINVGKQTLELAGQLSPQIRIDIPAEPRESAPK